MRWKNKIQKLGRIQIPTQYLKAYEINEGDEVEIEEKEDKLILSFERKNKKKIVSEKNLKSKELNNKKRKS